MVKENENDLRLGDLVRVTATRQKVTESPALIVDRDIDGWLRVKWLQPPQGLDGLDRWFPPSKLIMISRACEKKQEI